MIQERVRAGLARAKGEGKRLGRPPIPAKLEDAIRAALAEPGRRTLPVPTQSDISAVEKSRHSHAPTC